MAKFCGMEVNRALTSEAKLTSKSKFVKEETRQLEPSDLVKAEFPFSMLKKMTFLNQIEIKISRFQC